MAKKTKRPRTARKLSTLDDFLAREGKRAAFEAVAIKEVLAWQIGEAMKASKLSRNGLAQRMKTSRSQVRRLLDPKDGNVTLATLQRTAKKRWRLSQVGLSPSEAEELWQSAKNHFYEAVYDHAEKLKAEISGRFASLTRLLVAC